MENDLLSYNPDDEENNDLKNQLGLFDILRLLRLIFYVAKLRQKLTLKPYDYLKILIQSLTFYQAHLEKRIAEKTPPSQSPSASVLEKGGSNE